MPDESSLYKSSNHSLPLYFNLAFRGGLTQNLPGYLFFVNIKQAVAASATSSTLHTRPLDIFQRTEKVQGWFNARVTRDGNVVIKIIITQTKTVVNNIVDSKN